MKIARLTSLCLTLLLMCVVSYPVFADYNTTVPTPKKSSVSVTAREWELSADVITKADAEIATLFPKAKKVRSASRKYNCHSYAWYSTASTNY